MASRKGCKSVSTDELVSVEVARLGDTTVSLGGALEFLGGALEFLGGGTFPHRKLIKSSLRIVLLRFFNPS